MYCCMLIKYVFMYVYELLHLCYWENELLSYSVGDDVCLKQWLH